MKKVLIILCAPLSLFCQDTRYDHQVELNSIFLLESNNLDQDFFNAFLYGGYITDDMKTEWINAGSENNNIYSEISNGINYDYHFKNQSIGFSFYDRNIINTSFTDDLLRLCFEGNFHHQEKTLDFGGTNIRADRFQQYKLSYGSSNIKGGISFLAGNHHLSYIIENGSLYTALLGSSLDIAYDMNAFVTDTSTLSLFANNGNGLAVDLNVDFSIKDNAIHLSITDLGFIVWNTSSITLGTDSSFNFQGVEVEDIFIFNDSVLEANNIIDDVSKTNNSSFKSYIPATIHASISRNIKHDYFSSYTAGIITKWQPYQDNMSLSLAKIGQGFQQSNYAPFFYLQSIAHTKYVKVLPSISYGGYTNNTNIGLAIAKGKRNRLVLGTQHLEAILQNDEIHELSLYLQIKIQF